MHATFLIFLLYFSPYVLYSYGQVKNYIGILKADIKQFPYQLSLEIDGKPKCSASIISKYWAITSAFCVHNVEESQVAFRAGTNDKSKNGTLHHAQKIGIHVQYNSNACTFDYAVVKVKEPFPIGKPGVNKVILAGNEVVDKTIANISGWGVIANEPHRKTTLLHYIQVPIVNRAICKGIYWSIQLITKQMLCAGYCTEGKGPCEGDLGSPLVVNGTLIGIVSKTFCDEQNRPAIYSNVADQREWITQVTGV